MIIPSTTNPDTTYSKHLVGQLFPIVQTESDTLGVVMISDYLQQHHPCSHYIHGDNSSNSILQFYLELQWYPIIRATILQQIDEANSTVDTYNPNYMRFIQSCHDIWLPPIAAFQVPPYD